MNANHTDVTAVSVGALAGVGKLLHDFEPFLADLSYIAAIVLAAITIYYKVKNKGIDK